MANSAFTRAYAIIHYCALLFSQCICEFKWATSISAHQMPGASSAQIRLIFCEAFPILGSLLPPSE